LQGLIYKLSKVGQAIDKNDLPAAGSVLGSSSDAQWVQNVNAAFSKVWPNCFLYLYTQLMIPFSKAHS
jgi:hypothetical protein